MVIYKNPKKEWKVNIIKNPEKLIEYDLRNYPDYVSGDKLPNLKPLHQISYLEEEEREWGKKWGAIGIGKLREVGMCRPMPFEESPLWNENQPFFMLKRGPVKYEQLVKGWDNVCQAYKDEGITVHLANDVIEPEDLIGVYGPLRKVFMWADFLVIRGGAILPRLGHASYKRGLNRIYQKFLTSIGCPILYTVHGNGILESGILRPYAEGVVLACYSCAMNEDGLQQVMPVLSRGGIKLVVTGHCTSFLDSFETMGDFHLGMVMGPMGFGVALAYPPQLDWTILEWLKDHNFKILEIPKDEHYRYLPSNGVPLGPDKVMLPQGAKKTIAMVRKEGIDVVEVDTEGIYLGGYNGIWCMTNTMVRDPGPELEELKK